MPNKAFFEITNACNLSCSFCHGTKREIKHLSSSEFEAGAKQLRSFADYLYFHLMGEPLLHPSLEKFLNIAGELGFKVILTTNGTLLDKKKDILLSAKALHKVSISLHSYEANDIGISADEYLKSCFEFCREAADNGIIAVMRLWNEGGENNLNQKILEDMHSYFTGEWKEIYSGYKLRNKIFLEWGQKFDWPDVDAEYAGDTHSCYGLRDQIGVLSDGTVVPCCLDAEGAINLGNIFDTPLDEILNSPRARALKESFEKRKITEELCKHCGYAKMRY